MDQLQCEIAILEVPLWAQSTAQQRSQGSRSPAQLRSSCLPPCLQGGKEAKHSNRVLHEIIVRAIEEEAPEVGRDLIGLVTSREGVAELLVHDDVIDLVIPRGSNSLVRSDPLMTSCMSLTRCVAGGVCSPA